MGSLSFFLSESEPYMASCKSTSGLSLLRAQPPSRSRKTRLSRGTRPFRYPYDSSRRSTGEIYYKLSSLLRSSKYDLTRFCGLSLAVAQVSGVCRAPRPLSSVRQNFLSTTSTPSALLGGRAREFTNLSLRHVKRPCLIYVWFAPNILLWNSRESTGEYTSTPCLQKL